MRQGLLEKIMWVDMSDQIMHVLGPCNILMNLQEKKQKGEALRASSLTGVGAQ